MTSSAHPVRRLLLVLLVVLASPLASRAQVITEFSDYEFDQSKTPYITGGAFFHTTFLPTYVEFDGLDDGVSNVSFWTPPTLSSTPTSLLLNYDFFFSNSSASIFLSLDDFVTNGVAIYMTTWDQFSSGGPGTVEFPLVELIGTVTTVSRIQLAGGSSSGGFFRVNADRLTAVPEPRGVALGVALLLAFLVVRRRRARAV